MHQEVFLYISVPLDHEAGLVVFLISVGIFDRKHQTPTENVCIRRYVLFADDLVDAAFSEASELLGLRFIEDAGAPRGSAG